MNRLIGLPSGMNSAVQLWDQQEAKGGLAMLGQSLVSLSYLITYLQPMGTYHDEQVDRLAMGLTQLCGRGGRKGGLAMLGQILVTLFKPIPIV